MLSVRIFFGFFAPIYITIIKTYAQNTENYTPQAHVQSNFTKNSNLASHYLELADSFKLELHYSDAINYYLKAAALFKNSQNWEKYTSTTNNIAKYYLLSKQYLKAKEYATLALETGLDYLSPNHLNIAMSYAELMSFYYDYGQDYQTAIMYGRKALRICRLSKPNRPHRVVQSDLFHQLGITYCTQGIYDSAYINYHKALKLRKLIYNNKPTNYDYYMIGGIHASIAYYFRDIKQFDSSLFYHKQAIQCYKQYPKKWGKHSLSTTYMILSGTYRKLHNYKISIHFAHQAVQINKELFGPNHEETALAHRSLGIAYRENQQYYVALNHFQKVLIIRTYSFTETSIYSNPNIEDYKNDYKALQGLISKAVCFKKMYEFDTKNLKDLQFSLSTALDGITLLDKMREKLIFKESNKGLMNMMWFCFELIQSVSHQLYKITGNTKYIDLAFQTAEKSKAFMLWQSVGRQETQYYNWVPQTILNKEKILINNIDFFKENLYLAKKNQNKQLIQIYNDSLLFYKEKQHRLIKLLKQNYPEYYKFRYSKSVATIHQIQQTLDVNSLVLSFFEGDSAFYVFKISKTMASFSKINNLTKIANLIARLKREITTFPGIDKNKKSIKYQSFTESSHLLYEILVEPFITEATNSIANRLVIIPDGKISHIPFEVLLTRDPDSLMKKNTNYRDLSYLIKKYAIIYNYSATLQLHNTTKITSKNNGRCLAIAPNYMGVNAQGKLAQRNSMNTLRNQTLEALPGAQNEVRSISNFFDGVFLLGDEATESNFKKEAGEYAIIHLAMHGKSNLGNDHYSKLVFTKAKHQREDDTLFSYELNNIKLKADLVVLSACETGKGNFVRGEGVMSMSRGFMLAGSPSVLQTLWESADHASTFIITNFYRDLSEGMHKDIALKEARLKYLRENTTALYSHPFYWSGFVLLGSNKPVSLKNTSNYKWSIIGIMGLVFAILLAIPLINLIKNKRTRP